MNLDVLLVNLPTSSWYREKLAKTNSMPPLGLLYIATYLKKKGFNVKILDFAVESFTMDYFLNELKLYKPKIVGMSTYNESWEAQKVLCRVIKDNLPETIIFAGGAFATFCFDDVLRKSMTDYVVRGEGEIVTAKLVEHILKNKNCKISEIKGLAYIGEDGMVINTGISERIKNLDDELGFFPDRDLVDLKKYIMPYTISTARGCPGDCIFCSSKSFWGKQVCLRSAEKVFEEVMYLHNKYNAMIFYITDDTFTASYNRVVKFCNMILDSGINFVWGCESRADVLNDKLVSLMVQSGCRKLQIGLESADNDILSKIKKHVTIEEIENGIALARKYGLHVTASYIIGHAFDTHETINKTLSFAKKIQNKYGAHVVGSVNTPFPGTEQYDRRDELGIEIHERDWNQFVLSNPIISTNNITRDDLRRYHSIITDIMGDNRN